MKLIAPESYKKASKKARKKVCNGCGPKSYDMAVPDNLLGLDISKA